MTRRRRIVPDNSVVVPAFFKETIEYRNNEFPLSRRASEIVRAIRAREVDAIAPEHLVYEFLKVALRKSTEGVGLDEAWRQAQGFLLLWSTSIRSARMADLADRAWHVCAEADIPSPDSWYLACAMTYDAELWVAKDDDADHFFEQASHVYPNIHALTQGTFGSV